MRSLFVTCLLLAIFVLGSASWAFGFSFGGIQVRSGFGDRFDAEIELNVEGDEVEVALGDEADYKRLELDRRDIIDRLDIVLPLKERGGKKIIRVVSETPLFFPSFHLVVRATHYGGTLLKMYLITVDFKQSLALNVQGAKKKSALPSADEPVDLLEHGSVSAGGERGEPADSGGSPAGGPAPEKDGLVPETLVPTDAELARAPAATVTTRVMRRHHAGAIWVSPRPQVKVWFPPEPSPEVANRPQNAEAPEVTASPETAQGQTPPLPEETAESLENVAPGSDSAAAPASEEALAPEPGDDPPVGDDAGFGGDTVREGESLFDVATRLAPEGVEVARVTVALWMDNQGKFIDGNMNWIREGTRLNLENLEHRLADLDTPLAQKVLWSQWQEWKLIRKKRMSPAAAEANEPIEEKALPVERALSKEGMFAVAREWARTWEEGDLKGHLASFAASEQDAGPGLAKLKSRKRRMFKNHSRVRIETHPAALVFKSGRPWLSFNQVFHSDRIESFGRKDLALVREGDAWKIADEKFDLRQYKEKGGEEPEAVAAEPPAERRYFDAPFVVHVSTQPDYISATRSVNLLRDRGYDAYSAPVSMPGGQTLHRVYLGRFADWDLAREMAAAMRSLAVGGDAVPVFLPYTLEIGRYVAEEQALERLQNLRRRGFSALLYVNSETDFSQPVFHVFLDAFASDGDARKLAEKLTALGIPFTRVTP